MKAREQERKEIEALHRWEEAHIFEGGGRDKLLDNSFHRKNLEVSAALFCTCQLVLAISCKNLSKSAKSQKKEETFQRPICSPKLESG